VAGAPPPVPRVVQVVRVDGGAIMMAPVTAALGLQDLVVYRWDLESLFSVNRLDYPADSIANVKRLRAADWVRRLTALPAAEQPDAVQGWQRIPFAKLAALAANDTLARQLFELRVAELASDPVEQSYALFQAVATLVDPLQDSARLVRNLAFAERYVKSLRTIRTTGYTTRHDSITVLRHQLMAEDTLINGYAVANDTTQLLTHARARLRYALLVGVEDRRDAVFIPYRYVCSTLMHTAVGRTQIATFANVALAMARRAGTELSAKTTADDHKRARTIETDIRSWIQFDSTWLARLNTPAPELTAHLWLNTPDSMYDSTPRRHPFADGRVHVLAFGDLGATAKMFALDRVQRRFPFGVEALLAIATTGSVGPDAATPREEAAWITQYLRDVHHLIVPIAVWAGALRQAGMVPEGHYPVVRPEPSPNDRLYIEGPLGPRCFLIDGHGRLRLYLPIVTRHDEVVLWKHIQLLLDEQRSTMPNSPGAGASSSMPVPTSRINVTNE